MGQLRNDWAGFCSHRATPQSTTGISPAELLLGRKQRSKLDLIHPDLTGKVKDKQRIQEELHDRQSENEY